MKRVALFLALLLAAPALAVDVDVNGQRLPAQPAPIMESGRVLVPMRAVFAALGAEVGFRNGVITVSRGSDLITLRPGQTQAQVNGRAVTLESPAKLANGTTYVPLRFVAQALGEKVSWNASKRLVVVGQSTAGNAVGQQVGSFATSAALRRLVVGNQGGVLKIWDTAGKEVAFYRGLDDRSVARLSTQDQQQILSQFGLSGSVDAVDGAAEQVMSSYGGVTQKKEALALLGVFNSLDGTGQISPATAGKVRSFLVARMKADKAVEARRQAVLALAVGNGLETSTTQAVLDFYAGSENLWETFPVQQFFEYQADRLKATSDFSQVKARALSVNSLYRQNILGYLGD
jgi:hypothetical protein